jgi:hypothetical protein
VKQCGEDLSRANIRQATNIKDLELPMGLPGTRINTSPDNGHRSIVSTVRYTALTPNRFRNFWKD